MGRFTTLKLMRGDVQLGVLTLYDLDQPWFYCHFEPEPAFEQVRPLFAAEQELLNDDSGTDFDEDADEDAWVRAYQDIQRLGLLLIPDVGEVIDDFLLHIDGTEAWFRY
jgi:hypothetical protein